MAGIHAAGYVKNGMKVGLGTGSTVKYTILELGRRIRNEGLIISCVPTSISTEKLSIEQGIKLYELSILEGLDLVIDCLLYTSPSPRDRQKSRMPSSA